MLHLFIAFHHPVYTYCVVVISVLIHCAYCPMEEFSFLPTLYANVVLVLTSVLTNFHFLDVKYISTLVDAQTGTCSSFSLGSRLQIHRFLIRKKFLLVQTCKSVYFLFKLILFTSGKFLLPVTVVVQEDCALQKMLFFVCTVIQQSSNSKKTF